jgi:hypothetical protein
VLFIIGRRRDDLRQPFVADLSGMTRSIRLATLFLPIAWGASPLTSGAQASCTRLVSDTAPPARQWQPPLDRQISPHENGVSLRDALDRLAVAARLRLAYSADLLPLARRVCLAYRSVAAGTALLELLDGLAVEPVVTDSNRVVLTPAHTNAAASAPASVTQRSGVLERVVVTGSVNGCRLAGESRARIRRR